ncbi:hypothetical protein ACQ86G_29195 [Roseateles chitinivorans]|uniref:hypothetical protein n=1 Tax=Roseateles chitinivorans TaxID=2917965 RepID=UPI003D66D4D3
MTEAKRHPFLDDLAEDVILTSSILRGSVKGRRDVLKVVKAGAAQYAQQTPIVLGDVGDRSYFEYAVTLKDGTSGTGLVSIRRDGRRQVTSLEICFSPLQVVLSMAQGTRDLLADEFDVGLFV